MGRINMEGDLMTFQETDGDHFEEMRSLEQNLTFEKARKEFADRNIKFGQV